MQRMRINFLKRLLFCFLGGVLLSFFIAGCKKDDDDEMTKSDILASTRWKTTVVRDSVGKDVTADNQGFVGLADYKKDGKYIFYTLDGTPRGDEGYWALTADGNKRILYSTLRNYTRVVDIVELTRSKFTYRVVNTGGKTVTVEHVPV